MLLQIVIGTGLLVAHIVVMAMASFLLETAFLRLHPWLLRPPQRTKLVLLLAGVGLWVLAVITSGVWLWALVLHALGAFATLETSVYFTLVVFTTLGLGDIVPPAEWRILAVMAAVNGFLGFGLMTALLVETLRQVRLTQLQTGRAEDPPPRG